MLNISLVVGLFSFSVSLSSHNMGSAPIESTSMLAFERNPINIAFFNAQYICKPVQQRKIMGSFFHYDNHLTVSLYLVFLKFQRTRTLGK